MRDRQWWRTRESGYAIRLRKKKAPNISPCACLRSPWKPLIGINKCCQLPLLRPSSPLTNQRKSICFVVHFWTSKSASGRAAKPTLAAIAGLLLAVTDLAWRCDWLAICTIINIEGEVCYGGFLEGLAACHSNAGEEAGIHCGRGHHSGAGNFDQCHHVQHGERLPVAASARPRSRPRGGCWFHRSRARIPGGCKS